MKLKAWAMMAAGSAALSFLSGCGSTCADIRAHRAAFSEHLFESVSVEPNEIQRKANARLTVPFELLDQVITAELGNQRRPHYVVNSKGKNGDWTELSLELQGLKVIPAEPGKIGIQARFHLYLNRLRSLEMTLDVAVEPTLTTHQNGRDARIQIRVDSRSLGRIQPELTENGLSALQDWIREQLPKGMRAFAHRDLIKPLVDEALSLVSRELWPGLRASLGDEPLFESDLVIPALHVAAMRSRSTSNSLIFDLVSQAQASPLSPSEDLVSGSRMALRMAGPVAAALVSDGMEQGRLPGRFDSKGNPKADGEWEARVAWRGGAKPLALHMWRTEGKCERAVVGAKAKLALQGDVLEVRLSEGRMLSNRGPAFAETFGWLQGIFGSSLNASFKTASLLSFETDSRRAQVRLARADIGEEVLLELDLGLVRRTRRTSSQEEALPPEKAASVNLRHIP